MAEQRLEKKFVYSEGDVSYKFFLISGMFKKAFPERVVNSIYFDTEMFQDVWDNINGYGDRKKIRIRWYNNLENSKAFIEEKKKIGFVTQKKVKDIGMFGSFSDLNDFIKSDKFLQIHPIIGKKLNLNKTLFIQYQRSYYELPNKKLRVTVDNNLKIYLDYPFKFIKLDKKIIELKYEVKNSKFVNLFIKKNSLNNRNQKFSKYVNSFIELNESAHL